MYKIISFMYVLSVLYYIILHAIVFGYIINLHIQLNVILCTLGRWAWQVNVYSLQGVVAQC